MSALGQLSRYGPRTSASSAPRIGRANLSAQRLTFQADRGRIDRPRWSPVRDGEDTAVANYPVGTHLRRPRWHGNARQGAC
jgi:hypothetical protein